MATKLLIGLALLGILLVVMLSATTTTRRVPSRERDRSFTIHPIAKVRKRGSGTTIEIDSKYETGLVGLDAFSHVWVLWWFDRNDTPAKRQTLMVHPRGDKNIPLTGVFATRAPVRPNLVALTLCEVLSVDRNEIHVADIDALDGTPVIDLKPYIPSRDRTEDVRLPAWLDRHQEK